MAKTKVPEGKELMDAIVAKRDEVLEARDLVESLTRELSELVALTQDDEDPDVNPTAAARAMGLHKQRAFQMIASLDDE